MVLYSDTALAEHSCARDVNKGSEFVLILISLILHSRLMNIKQVHSLAEPSGRRHCLRA